MYVCIDLKSFYASVECVERGLDPMTTNLVVADESRTQKTICLAVSPSLKAYGIPGRARLFEVVERVKQINAEKTQLAGSSVDSEELEAHSEWKLDFLIAPPRMALYMKYSTRIYQTYLKYVAPEDIHVYSIDEVWMDLTPYLSVSGLTAYEFTKQIIQDIYQTTGITAAAGIGTNLYLSKIAMDIMAKRVKADSDGVRIAELDEMSYRRQLWNHRPITDFWRVGRGYAKKLEACGIYTMGDVARCSIGDGFYNEELLYQLFGVNAELLIDHAWGWEPCTMADIKAYQPKSNSIGSSQVLRCPYDFGKARLVVQEMADQLSLDLVAKGLVTDQVVLTVGYDRENLSDPEKAYTGPVSTDAYGRKIPKHAHGTENLKKATSSTKRITDAALILYDRVVDPSLSIRRLNLTANHVIPEMESRQEDTYEQLDLFTDYAQLKRQQEKEEADLEKERKMQQAMLAMKQKFGKNAIIKGMNLRDGATGTERNNQIGGHKA